MLPSFTPEQLQDIVRQSMGRAAVPEVRDERLRARALRIATDQGLLEKVRQELTPDRPIPVLPLSAFREYSRTGVRTGCERLMRWRGRQVELAAIGCWLGMDYWRYLQDLIWADCEQTWWIMPAHEGHSWPFDLLTAGMGRTYATILALIGDRLEDEVRQRLTAELRRRVLEAYLDEQRPPFWRTYRNNWNAVCHCGLLSVALRLEEDPRRLGRVLGLSLEGLRVFLENLAEDGGCSEGPSYWRYGFGHYVRLAAMLHEFTDGRINLLAGERIERACRYPLAVTVRPGMELTFADAHEGWQDPVTAILINRFVRAPELYGLCRLTAEGQLAVGSLEDLLLYDGRPCSPAELTRDELLPSLGVVKLYGGPLAVGAKAGHNDEMHNHNDVGSFILYRGRTVFLCDAGAPVYSARTFSKQRYESVFVNSLGHSVPVIDGSAQGTGKDFSGTLAAEGLNGAGAKTVRIEMGKAYPVPSLARLQRRIELPPGGKEMALSDRFEFRQAPQSVREVFMTWLPAEPSADGRTVTIRSEADGAAELRAEPPGRFTVQELTEESKAESRTGGLLRRIAFVPADLAKSMELRFTVSFR